MKKAFKNRNPNLSCAQWPAAGWHVPEFWSPFVAVVGLSSAVVETFVAAIAAFVAVVDSFRHHIYFTQIDSKVD